MVPSISAAGSLIISLVIKFRVGSVGLSVHMLTAFLPIGLGVEWSMLPVVDLGMRHQMAVCLFGRYVQTLLPF